MDFPSLKSTQSKSTRNYWVLAIIIVICYGLHLRYATLEITDLSTTIRSDAELYYIYAYNIHNEHIYSKEATTGDIKPKPDSFCPPAFPFFASLFWENTNYFVPKVLWGQTLIQIVSFLILNIMLFRCTQGVIALIGSLMIWTFPHFIAIDMYFLTESLFVSIIALIIAISLKQKLTSIDWILLGILCGVGALTRSTLEYFSIFVFLILAFRKAIKREHIYFLIASLIPIIGWKIRNYIATGAPADPTLMISALYHGSFPDFMFNHDPRSLGYAYQFDPESAKAYQSIRSALGLIIERATNAPMEYAQWYLIGKQFFLWQWYIFEGWGDIYIYNVENSPWERFPDMIVAHDFHRFLHQLWVAPSVIFSIYLFFKKETQQNQALFICTALIIFCMLLHAITAPYTRYGIPFKLPLMLIFLVALNWGLIKINALVIKKTQRI